MGREDRPVGEQSTNHVEWCALDRSGIDPSNLGPIFLCAVHGMPMVIAWQIADPRTAPVRTRVAQDASMIRDNPDRSA